MANSNSNNSVSAGRTSAIDAHFEEGRFGHADSLGVQLRLVESMQLGQIAAWPETLGDLGAMVAAMVANSIDEKYAPGPCKAQGNAETALLRVEPLKWWLLGAELPEVSAQLGCTIDLSHSRTRIRVSGQQVTTLLNRHLPINLGDSEFPINSVASSMIHHVGVTLWRNDQGYDLFIPRGFAVSVWEALLESSLQFGVEVSRA